MHRSPVSARATLLATVVAITSVAGGCLFQSGSGNPTVYGTVTLDGTPIPEGVIALIPALTTNGPTAGGLIVKGAYNISEKGPGVGKYKVQITAIRKTGQKVPAPMPAPAGTFIEVTEQYIPENYNTKSTLDVEFKKGSNKHDFTLTSAPATAAAPKKP